MKRKWATLLCVFSCIFMVGGMAACDNEMDELFEPIGIQPPHIEFPEVNWSANQGTSEEEESSEEKKPHKHAYTNSNYDEECHWKECSCGEKIDKTTHTFSVWYEEGEIHQRDCGCGYQEQGNHIDNGYIVDEISHWKNCSVCHAKISSETHNYGIVRHNDDYHWTECSCGLKTVEEKHVMANFLCNNCGYKVDYIRTNKDKTPNKQGEYILFGSYPQTKVVKTSILCELNNTINVLPSAQNRQGWISYEYYIQGSKETDFMWYIDKEWKGEKYRGVYFVSHRPYRTDYMSNELNTFQEDNGFTTGEIYWFKYEPIQWRILSENNGIALILCEMLLDSQEFHYTNKKTEMGSKYIYASNYVESSIRAWLNYNFYNTAFDSLQKQLIMETSVDNSIDTTNLTLDTYICENTVDNIFLLSWKDMINTEYGFKLLAGASDDVRRKQSTDYAQCQGAFGDKVLHDGDDGIWWLRTPYSDSNVHYVLNDGYSDMHMDVNDSRCGICPALNICLL